MNHEDGGFDCPGCAWPDSQDGLKLDFCENGVKHVTWELTGRRVEREFFASHTVSELRSWSDYALEAEGRLVEPMAYDAGTDRMCRSGGRMPSRWWGRPCACGRRRGFASWLGESVTASPPPGWPARPETGQRAEAVMRAAAVPGLGYSVSSKWASPEEGRRA